MSFFIHAIERQRASINPQGTRPHQNDAVKVVWLVGKELLHALLAGIHLKVAADLKTVNISIFVGSVELHSDVVNAAHVIMAHVDYQAGRDTLLQSDRS